jgi:hypothetical protein
METNQKTILDLLKNKSALKQDIADDTQNAFLQIRKILEIEMAEMRKQVGDERVRVSVLEKGDHELQVMIGSDALFFQKHSNVFRLEENHPLMQDDEIQKNPELQYFGMINIYNFLADSVLYNRFNDAGFLIGRIFINKNHQLFVEGRGQLDFLFKRPQENPVSDQILKHIIQCSFSFALDFDLLIPRYEDIEEVNLHQILAISNELQIKTSKRVGFKQ